MERLSVVGGLGLAAVLLVVCPVCAAEKAAAPDQELVRQALALNEITGDAAIHGKIKALVRDPQRGKKLLAAAAAQTRGKSDSPFTYNAAYILAQTARELKDLEHGELFYRVCIAQARKLSSTNKLAAAYRGLLGLLMERGKFEESGKLCREILEMPERQGQAGELKLAVLQMYIETLIRQGKTPKDKQANTDKALALADSLVKARPGDWQALEIKATALRLAGQGAGDKQRQALQEQSLAAFQAMMQQILAGQTLNDEQRRAFDEASRYLVEQGKADVAVRLAEDLARAHPGDWRAMEPRAWALREAGRSPDAAQAYEQVIKAIRNDATLGADQKEQYTELFRYILSGVYVDANQIAKAAEYLQGLLAEKPDSPTYNNDLGYIWADHDMKLDESERMIRKALDEDRKQRRSSPSLRPENDRDNAAYLDSLGWVLFKKKQYDEAKKYLLEAIKDKDEGQHIDIYDHLADTCMALGQRDEAVSAWKKALQVAGRSRREQERKAIVEKKLRAAEAPVGRKP